MADDDASSLLRRAARMDTPKSRHERYLEHAMELRAMSQAATNPAVKAELLSLARQYDKLAKDVLRREN